MTRFELVELQFKSVKRWVDAMVTSLQCCYVFLAILITCVSKSSHVPLLELTINVIWEQTVIGDFANTIMKREFTHAVREPHKIRC